MRGRMMSALPVSWNKRQDRRVVQTVNADANADRATITEKLGRQCILQ